MIPLIICIKRNIKNLFFILLLVIMPFTSMGYNYIGNNVSKNPAVGLYFESKYESFFDEIHSDVIDFKKYDNKALMQRDIENGILDCGYIFGEKFDNGVESLDFKKSIDVLTSSSSVIQPVVNEFIFKEILKNTAPNIANKFFDNEIDADKYYTKFLESDDVFNIEFEIINDNKEQTEKYKIGNIFALFILIAVVISSITVIKDRQKGVRIYNFTYIFSSTFLIMLSAVVALVICGEFKTEDILIYLLYMVIVSLISYIISFVKSPEFVCGIIPVLVLCCLVFSPIVFNIGIINNYLEYGSYIFPTTYFIKKDIIGMIIYGIVIMAIAMVIKIRKGLYETR